MTSTPDNPFALELAAKLRNHSATIGVVGLGYVGLPLLTNILEHGFSACGFDNDQHKLDALRAGESYISHLPVAAVQTAVAESRCQLAADFAPASECDVVILCLPTPLNRYREPDLSYVTNSMDQMIPHLRAGQAIVLESTTYPGTTEEELLPRLAAAGFDVGENYFLVYSPEREDPGNQDFTFTQIPKVVGGITAQCTAVGVDLYQHIGSETVPVSSAKVAEMSKILENTYRSVNIALVNELKVLAHAMDVDIFEVIDAAATKPFGFQPFYPGPGLGGHCIPIDPFYLTWKAREYGFHTRFIELAGEVNTAMPQYVIDRTIEGLNSAGKAVRGASILVLGVAYKKNVGDVRESPGVHIIDRLLKLGAKVEYHDPHVEQLPKMRDYQLQMSHRSLSQGDIAGFDCCIIATDHDQFDYRSLREAQLVIDARGRLQNDDEINFLRA